MSYTIIVPHYNELRKNKKSFYSQLYYFKELSDLYNVTLIDDHSNDGSWEEMKKLSKNSNINLIRMDKNTKKVGAIKKGVEDAYSKYVVLTDFDCRFKNPENLNESISNFYKKDKLAAIALKVVPKGSSLLSKFQDLDYLMGRAIGARYLNKIRKSRCVAGAGGIWRRDVLLSIFPYHSGRHNGDDMELTALAMKFGYEIMYDPNVIIETIVPQNLKELLKQRVRWELGALETFAKEKKFYFSQVKNLKNRFGHITLWEWYNWISIPLTGIIASISISNLEPYFLYYYLWDTAFTSLILSLSKNEIKNKEELLLLPLMPFFRAIVYFPAKIKAFYKFIKEVL